MVNSTNKNLMNSFEEALLEMDKHAAFELSRQHDNPLTLVEEMIVLCFDQRTLPQINCLVATHFASGACLEIIDDVVSTGTGAIAVGG